MAPVVKSQFLMTVRKIAKQAYYEKMSAISMETRNSGGVINRFRGTGDSRAPGLTSFYTGFDVVRDIFPFLFIRLYCYFCIYICILYLLQNVFRLRPVRIIVWMNISLFWKYDHWLKILCKYKCFTEFI